MVVARKLNASHIASTNHSRASVWCFRLPANKKVALRRHPQGRVVMIMQFDCTLQPELPVPVHCIDVKSWFCEFAECVRDPLSSYASKSFLIQEILISFIDQYWIMQTKIKHWICPIWGPASPHPLKMRVFTQHIFRRFRKQKSISFFYEWFFFI